MYTFGLQNEAFLRLKSVPKSTQKSDLEKRGIYGEHCARMVDFIIRVVGSSEEAVPVEYRFIPDLDGH